MISIGCVSDGRVRWTSLSRWDVELWVRSHVTRTLAVFLITSWETKSCPVPSYHSTPKRTSRSLDSQDEQTLRNMSGSEITGGLQLTQTSVIGGCCGIGKGFTRRALLRYPLRFGHTERQRWWSVKHMTRQGHAVYTHDVLSLSSLSLAFIGHSSGTLCTASGLRHTLLQPHDSKTLA